MGRPRELGGGVRARREKKIPNRVARGAVWDTAQEKAILGASRAGGGRGGSFLSLREAQAQ